MRPHESKSLFANLFKQAGCSVAQASEFLGVDESEVVAWLDFTLEDAPGVKLTKTMMRFNDSASITELVCGESEAIEQLKSVKSEMESAGETRWLPRISEILTSLLKA